MISYLCFIVSGLVRRHKFGVIHPFPLLLSNGHQIESFIFRGKFRPLRPLPPGFYNAALDNDRKYVIGVIVDGNLLPLTTIAMDPHNPYVYTKPVTYERYKLRIKGDHADEIVKMLNEDPLNNLFFEKFESKDVRFARVPPI